MRGWDAVPILRNEVSPASLPGLLKKYRPAACVVDGIARDFEFPPRLFGKTLISYIGYPRRKTGDKPNFMFDYDAIADSARKTTCATASRSLKNTAGTGPITPSAKHQSGMSKRSSARTENTSFAG